MKLLRRPLCLSTMCSTLYVVVRNLSIWRRPEQVLYAMHEENIANAATYSVVTHSPLALRKEAAHYTCTHWRDTVAPGGVLQYSSTAEGLWSGVEALFAGTAVPGNWEHQKSALLSLSSDRGT